MVQFEKIYMKYIQLLFPHQKTLFDQKTKDIYLIYIFNIAMFLKTGIYIYISLLAKLVFLLA